MRTRSLAPSLARPLTLGRTRAAAPHVVVGHGEAHAHLGLGPRAVPLGPRRVHRRLEHHGGRARRRRRSLRRRRHRRALLLVGVRRRLLLLLLLLQLLLLQLLLLLLLLLGFDKFCKHNDHR